MSAAFRLPEGNVQVAFSTGRTSGMMLRKIQQANPDFHDRIAAGTLVVIFTNTGREMPESLDFGQEVSERWNIPIVWLEYRANPVGNSLEHGFEEVTPATADLDGRPMVDVMRYHGFPPNREARFCSHQLKTRTARRYCVEVLGWGNWTTALGIRADESSRALKQQPRERYTVWYPMLNAGLGKRDVAAFWKRQPFDLRLPNVNGKTPLGNCDGCFLKSEANRAMLARDHPERAAWWAEQEARFGGTFHVSTSWRELIDVTRRQGELLFSTEGALCQASDGECVG